MEKFSGLYLPIIEITKQRKNFLSFLFLYISYINNEKHNNKKKGADGGTRTPGLQIAQLEICHWLVSLITQYL